MTKRDPRRGRTNSGASLLLGAGARIWRLLLAGASTLPSPMLIIGSCVAFGGEAGSGRLTLRIAREATIRPAFDIFDTVMSRGNDGACVRRFGRAEGNS